MNITRLHQKTLFETFENPFISILIGARRTGKTSLVNEYLKGLQQDSFVSFNLDDLDTRTLIEKSRLEELIEKRIGQKLDLIQKRLVVFIDEAQKAPGVFDQIKILYDRYKEKKLVKFILSGSGSLSLHHYSAETLTGRGMIYFLSPFSLQETWRLRFGETTLATPLSQLLLSEEKGKVFSSELEKDVLSLYPYQNELVRLMQEQLIWGGFPEVLGLTKNDDRKRYLSAYRQTYLERDIRSLSQVADLKDFNQVLEIIAFQVGSPRQDKRIYETVGIAPQTFKKYLGILEATFLYKELSPYIFSPLRRIVKAPKAYLVDNGLLSYLRGIFDLDLLVRSGSIGSWFENWVLTQLVSLCLSEAFPPSFYYWRTSGGVEVDIVIRLGNRVIPIEVKYTSKPDRSLSKHLQSFMADRSQTPFGIVIYNGDFFFDKAEHIYYWPAWMLL